jgi:hypothetical protein
MDFIRRTWYSLNLKTRDKLTRAAKTAGQTFIASLPVAVVVGGDLPAAKAAVVAAAAAAVSAAWNTIWPPSTGEVKLVPILVKDFPKE